MDDVDRTFEEMEPQKPNKIKINNCNEINKMESQVMPLPKLEKEESPSCHLDGQATEMKINHSNNDLIDIQSELSDINPEVDKKLITDIEIEDTQIQPSGSDNWKIDLNIDNFIIHVEAETSTVIKTKPNLVNPSKSFSETAETDNEDSTLLQTGDKNNCSNTVLSKHNRKRKYSSSFPLEDYFTEYLLSLEEQKEEVEKKQLLPKYVESLFKCTDCFEGFSCEKSFLNHRSQWHGNKPDHEECPICKKQFNEKQYYLHVIDHRAIYNCRFCSFKALNIRQARAHALIHQGKILTCPHCNLQFRLAPSYYTHIRIKHVTNVVCEFCGFSYLNTAGLKQHKKKKHEQEMMTVSIDADNPTCSTCNIRFATDKALNTHFKISHAVEPGERMRNDEYQKVSKIRKTCELCGVDIKDGRAYRGHFTREHPGEVPVEVPPVRYSSDKLPPCEFCGRVFKTKHNLMEHALVHSGITPYECNKCGKKFSHKGAYTNHMVNFHNPTKAKEMRECGVCGKDFPSKGLPLHMRTHSSERPVKCEYCSNTYRFLKQLRSHKYYAHRDKPQHIMLESEKMSTDS